MVNLATTSDLADEQAESAESDVGRDPYNGQTRVPKRPSTPTPSRTTHVRWPRLLFLDLHAVSMWCSPKTELGATVDWQVDPLSSLDSLSSDLPNGDT